MTEREMIQADAEGMWELKKILKIRKHQCYYCKEHIKKGDKFSIFNKPTRLICNNIFCMIEALNEDEANQERQARTGKPTRDLFEKRKIEKEKEIIDDALKDLKEKLGGKDED